MAQCCQVVVGTETDIPKIPGDSNLALPFPLPLPHSRNLKKEDGRNHVATCEEI